MSEPLIGERTHVTHGGHVSSVRINLGGSTLFVVAVLATIIGACGLVMGLNLSKQSQQDASFREMKTQMWLVERRLMDREALDLRNGLMKPSDIEFGPAGNLHYKPEIKNGR